MAFNTSLMLQNMQVYVIVILCASIICLMFGWDTEHWTGIEKEEDILICDKFFNRMYFSFMTFSTIGFGDISPKSKQMKSVIMAMSVVILVGFVHIIFK